MRQDLRLKATAPVIHASACVHESRRSTAPGNRTLGACALFPPAAKRVLDPAGAVAIAAGPSLPAQFVAVHERLGLDIRAIRLPTSSDHSRIRAGRRWQESIAPPDRVDAIRACANPSIIDLPAPKESGALSHGLRFPFRPFQFYGGPSKQV